MKKLILTVTASLACLAAFAQGKINFGNDSLHLVYYTTDTSGLRGGDASLAGAGVSSALYPAGVTLVADLYAGTSAGSLALVSTTSFGVQVGRFASIASLTLPAGLAGGVAQTFQVQIRDSAFATAAAAAAGGSYSGLSAIFTTVPGSSIAYNSIVNLGAPSLSTWAVGQFDMSTQTSLAGARGVIVVSAVPEPTSFALAGLALAGLTILRRRK
jgi:hypothetical protein